MSSFGTTISQFNGWLQATRANRILDKDEIINAATRQTYILDEMFKTNEFDSMVGDFSGQYLEDLIKLDRLGGTRMYNPADERNPGRKVTRFAYRVPRRHAESDYSYTEAELKANAPGGSEQQFVQFKNFRKTMEVDLQCEHLDFFDDQCWNPPDYEQMELGSAAATDATARPGQFYSIPCFVTEPPSGGTDAWGGARPAVASGATAFSTVMGIDPGTTLAGGQPNWRNATKSYDASAIDDPQTGIFAAFDSIMLQIDYKVPSGYEAYMQTSTMRAVKCFTNLDGRTKYSRLLRDGNDSFKAGPQDPAYGNPTFNGVPVMYLKALDTSLLNQSAAVMTNEVYPVGRPRYFVVNLQFLKFKFDRTNRFRLTEPFNGGAKQYDAWVRYMVTWGNLICLDRRRHGIIYPA